MTDDLKAIFGKAKYVRIMLIDGDWVVDEIDNLNESSQWIDITEMVEEQND